MYYGARLATDYRQVWMDGMVDWSGALPQRMTDDGAEERFWQRYMADRARREDRTDPYADQVLESLLPMIQPTDTVLEIGPGWGNYTFALSRRAQSLTCVDSSDSVLRYLRETAAANGWPPFRTIRAKWETAPVAAKSSDVVFGMNCYYRMQEIEQALLKMDRTARRLAVAGMTIGPEQPHYWEIHHTLGYPIRFARRDYIHLTNVLYQLGIDVNCKLVPLEKKYVYETEEQLYKDQIGKIMLAEDRIDRKAVERILAKYVEARNGKWEYRHRFKAALLYWHPEESAGALEHRS